MMKSTPAALPSLATALAQVADPRSPHGRYHPWTGLLLLVAVGLLAGANTQRALARFGHHLRRPWLRRLGFRTPPSQPTLGRLLAALPVEQIEAILGRWLHEVEAAWRTNWPSSATRWLDAIAIDGKTLRGARRLGAADVQLLSAYRTASGVVLAELAVPDSTNELGAVGS